MLTINKSKDKFGLQLQGDFLDLDRLYFAIFKLTGQFGSQATCPFPGYTEVCEHLLTLCYDLRHAYEGYGSLTGVYNGVNSEWFEARAGEDKDEDADEDDYNYDYNDMDTSDAEDMDNNNELIDYENENENDNDDIDIDENYDDDFNNDLDELSCEACPECAPPHFDKTLLNDISLQNAYFGVDLSVPEAVFYAMVLEDVINQVDVLRTHMLQNTDDSFDGLAIEYATCKYQEDVAIVSLFIGKVWSCLYNIIGEQYFQLFNSAYQNNKQQVQNRLFINCDMDNIYFQFQDYFHQTPEMDHPESLVRTLLLMI